LALKLLATIFTALGNGNVQRLAADHLVVHFSNSFGGFIGRREADKAETFGGTLLVAHDLAAGDGAERLELNAKLLVVHIILQVLDVEIHALVLAQLLHLGLLVRPTELLLALGFLLRTGNEELLAIMLGVVELIDGLLSLFVVFIINKAKALALALFVNGQQSRRDSAELGEEFFKFVLTHLLIDVLDIKVCKLRFHLIKLGLTFLA